MYINVLDHGAEAVGAEEASEAPGAGVDLQGHASINKYIYIYIHTYEYIYIYMYTHVCTYVYIYI